MTSNLKSTDANDVHTDVFQFNDWTITACKSHILESKCKHPDICSANSNDSEKCLFCQFENKLQLQHFPDMTFAKNLLKIQHKEGYGIEFKALQALIEVKDRCAETTVSVAEDWQKAREDCKFAKQIKNKFDWTFTTYYSGHLISSQDDPQAKVIRVEPTTEQIDMEKLKVKEEILYFDEIDLFEDELADNGVAKLSVKIRVMQQKIFILLRFFLRVDKVKIKIHDTRIYYETNQNYFLKEFTVRECNENQMKLISNDILHNPVELVRFARLVKTVREKLIF